MVDQSMDGGAGRSRRRNCRYYCLQDEWTYVPFDKERMAVHIGDEKHYFERRGVVVIDQFRCYYNDAARKYLNKNGSLK
jgi:hypothetical protein